MPAALLSTQEKTNDVWHTTDVENHTTPIATVSTNFDSAVRQLMRTVTETIHVVLLSNTPAAWHASQHTPPHTHPHAHTLQYERHLANRVLPNQRKLSAHMHQFIGRAMLLMEQHAVIALTGTPRTVATRPASHTLRHMGTQRHAMQSTCRSTTCCPARCSTPHLQTSSSNRRIKSCVSNTDVPTPTASSGVRYALSGCQPDRLTGKLLARL